MQPKAERARDLLDRRAAEPARLRHAATAPVAAMWGPFQRPDDHLLDLVIADPTRGAPRFVIQPVQPLANNRPRHLETVTSDIRTRFATTSCRRLLRTRGSAHGVRDAAPSASDGPTSSAARIRRLSESAPP